MNTPKLLVDLTHCALADRYRPVMAHLFVTRRCNLSCGYCYEADRESPPVALAALKERIDHLHRLRTVFVTLTGGEPLLHPDLPEIVRYVRDLGMVPLCNSNGYLLTRERIEALNAAGLFAMQISIDTVTPNATTKKSLRPLRRKLALLAEYAEYRVRINTVLGSGDPAEALEVARAVVALGFDAKCSLLRDEHGRVAPLNDTSREIYQQIRALGRRSPVYLSEDFQLTLAERGTTDLKCRSGARYFMVCEKGLVHLCESSHGSPAKPLAEYDELDIQRAYHMPKSCASTCAVAYAHQLSRLDRWRSQNGYPDPIDKRSWMEARAASQLIPPARLARRAAAAATSLSRRSAA